MDEFMTLRRLNIRIQGFPESYATEPFMGASMVGAEPHPPSEPMLLTDPTSTIPTGGMMPADDMSGAPGRPLAPPPPMDVGTNTPTPEVMGAPSGSPPPPPAPPEIMGDSNGTKVDPMERNGPIAEITDLSGKEEKKEAN